MTHPLLDYFPLPPFAAITPDLVGPAIDRILAENRAAVAALPTDAATWASVPAVMEELQDRLDQAWAPVSHLNAVMNSEAWREAYNGCLPKLSAYGTELGQNAGLYQAYRALREGAEWATLNQAQRQLIDNALRDFKLSGVDLPPAEKQRFAAIQERLSTLSSTFADHLLDATQAWHKHVTDEAALAGLPESARALLAQLAAQRELDGWLVTLDAPSYLAVMMHADERGLRREVYEAYVTRASDQGPNAGQFDNSALMVEILALRQEAASLLGYRHYGDVSLVPKMAESVEQVTAFLRDLAAKAKPGAERDMVALRAFAATELGLAELAPWDIAYVSEKLKQARYALSQEDVRPYFPASKVVAGLFAIVQRLYDIDIRERPSVPTYHPDVRYYEVVEQGQVIAGFYLDLYARPNKRGGAWMADARVRRRRADGGLQLPVAFLTCNFNPPVGERPALLTHDEVTTLFHEFGHGLHHMLSEIEVAGVSGINGVAWDAVELPSQFLENWCWEPEGLALIASHVDTGAPLPTDLLEKMLAAKNFQSGLQMMRQLEFALFDLRIHSRAGLDTAGIQAVLDQTRAEVAVVPIVSWNRFQHSFSHIFAGGYAAGYFSYKWAEVLSADAFSRFEEEGIFNPDVGRAFREHILAKGGSVNAMDLFKAFRGREPQVDALLRHSGLTD